MIWYKVDGANKTPLASGDKYELVKKGDYVFLEVKNSDLTDRGQYVLVIVTAGDTPKTLVAYYILKVTGES